MKAIAFSPKEKRLRIVERTEPEITWPDQVKLRIEKVGVCGTDRERIAEGKATAPEGFQDIVMGHENFGRVVETGRDVRSVKPGDYAVFTIRRECGQCLPCAMNRPDMCRTGKYMDRGLSGIDGFNSEFAVDSERYVIPVPASLATVGVLLEPMSVVEKALDEAARLQSARLPDAYAEPDIFHGKRALVAGTGSVGLLACLALRLRGAMVFGLDVVDAGSPRASWLSALGCKYIDGRRVKPERLDEAIGPVDMVMETAGVPGLQFKLIDALARNAIYVVAGIPSEKVHEKVIQIPGTELMSQLVRNNQLLFGSVSSAMGHYRMALSDFILAEERWKGHAPRLINREFRIEEFEEALTRHPEEEIKSVFNWAA